MKLSAHNPINFEQTKIIDLGKEIASILVSRDIVKILEQEVNSTTKKIILDFKNVEFISRSAAHGLLYYIKTHKLKNIEFINMNQSVKKMLDIVENQLSEDNNNELKTTVKDIEIIDIE